MLKRFRQVLASKRAADRAKARAEAEMEASKAVNMAYIDNVPCITYLGHPLFKVGEVSNFQNGTIAFKDVNNYMKFLKEQFMESYVSHA